MCLQLIVGRSLDRQRFTGGVFRPELFIATGRIAADQLTGGAQYGLGAAVILLQPDDFGVGIIVIEVENIADLGPSPAVDRLIIIADHAEVIFRADQQLHKPILNPVGILKLIDQQVPEALLPAPPDLRMLFKQTHGQQQQVAEIDSIGVFQALLIKGVQLGQLALIGPLPGQLLGGQTTIFGAVDESSSSAWFQGALRDPLLFEQFAQ